jgi:tyrosine-protein phosphatase YwqE
MPNPFVPIRLVMDEPHKVNSAAQKENISQLDLVLRGGAVIRIQNDTDLKLVTRLLSTLEDKNA